MESTKTHKFEVGQEFVTGNRLVCFRVVSAYISGNTPTYALAVWNRGVRIDGKTVVTERQIEKAITKGTWTTL